MMGQWEVYVPGIWRSSQPEGHRDAEYGVQGTLVVSLSSPWPTTPKDQEERWGDLAGTEKPGHKTPNGVTGWAAISDGGQKSMKGCPKSKFWYGLHD